MYTIYLSRPELNTTRRFEVKATAVAGQKDNCR